MKTRFGGVWLKTGLQLIFGGEVVLDTYFLEK